MFRCKRVLSFLCLCISLSFPSASTSGMREPYLSLPVHAHHTVPVPPDSDKYVHEQPLLIFPSPSTQSAPAHLWLLSTKNTQRATDRTSRLPNPDPNPKTPARIRKKRKTKESHAKQTSSNTAASLA
ncbi:hypothetical protein FB567DRAFT_198147 [Paraphoma chrysanthemicola]|uniref:Secreted protein n=1 Tax=Paraphoma chrysanthemicola TaxID=798071 RepID=A0A8K0QWX2_9PLEO|nr:hypothetical protein FB567DRAFT_198147 [Paraphoma chrysanthemicola]